MSRLSGRWSGSTTLYDVNVWIALAFSSHPGHRAARRRFEARGSLRPAAFCRATQLAFLRLLTTPAVHEAYGTSAITNDLAWREWERLVTLPQVGWLEEPTDLQSRWRSLARITSPSPKIWADTYLAAFALGHAVSLASFDRDFWKYPELDLDLIGAE